MKSVFTFFISITFIISILAGCRKEDAAQIERPKTGSFLIEQSNGDIFVLGTKDLYNYRQVYWLRLNVGGDFVSGNQFGEVGKSRPLAFELNRSGSYGLLVENEPTEQQNFSYRYTICDSSGVPFDYTLLSKLPGHEDCSFKPTAMVQNDNYTHLIAGSCQKNGSTYSFTTYIHENGTYYESRLYEFPEKVALLDITKGIGGQNFAIGLSDIGNLWMLNLTHKGDTVWTKKYAYSKTIYPRTVRVNKNGDILVAGHYDEVGKNSFISIFTGSGELQWTNYYNGSIPDHNAVVIDENNELFCALNHGGYYDILKINEDGQTIWIESIGIHLGTNVQINGAYQTLSNEYLVLGNITSEHEVTYIYLAKFDVFGNQLWQKTW